jgi:hypothetical protein
MTTIKRSRPQESDNVQDQNFVDTVLGYPFAPCDQVNAVGPPLLQQFYQLNLIDEGYSSFNRQTNRIVMNRLIVRGCITVSRTGTYSASVQDPSRILILYDAGGVAGSYGDDYSAVGICTYLKYFGVTSTTGAQTHLTGLEMLLPGFQSRFTILHDSAYAFNQQNLTTSNNSNVGCFVNTASNYLVNLDIPMRLPTVWAYELGDDTFISSGKIYIAFLSAVGQPTSGAVIFSGFSRLFFSEG